MSLSILKKNPSSDSSKSILAKPTSVPQQQTKPQSVVQAVEKVSSGLFDKLGSVFKSIEGGAESLLGKASSENVPGAQFNPKPKAMEFPILTGPSEADINKKIADLQVAKKSVIPTNKKSIDDYNAKVTAIQKDIGSFNDAGKAQNVLGKEYIPTPYDSPMKILSHDLSRVLNEPIEGAGEVLGDTKLFKNLAQGSTEKKTIPRLVENLAKYGQALQGVISGFSGGIIQPEYRNEPDNIGYKIFKGISEGAGAAAGISTIESGLFKGITAPEAILNTFQQYPKVQTLFSTLARNIPAFATYGQLNPDVSGFPDRLKALGKDIALAVPFTGLGLVNSKTLLVPASAALGFGIAKLQGASNEEAGVAATTLGLLSIMGGKEKSSKEVITQRQAQGQLYDEAINTINKYADTKLGSEPTPKEIKDAFKEAALKTHPDRGGDAKDFSAVSYAKDVLLGESKTTESVMEKQRAQDSKDAIRKTAEEFTTPAKQEKNPFKADIQDVASGFKVKTPVIDGINPKQETKLSLKDAQPLAENASKQYYDKFIAPSIKAGKAAVIGADDLKDYFGKDYNDNNHPVYSRAAHLVFERALKENPSPEVILTGGGPASGKTELVTKALLNKGFSGTIYDSNMANYDGVVKQIQMARDAGKHVQIQGVIPNLENSRTFSIQREDKIGRGISDNTFARGHAGFPEVLEKLLAEGIIEEKDVHILDTRETTSIEEAVKKVVDEDYVKEPLALLKELGYNEQDLKKIYAKENYDKKTGERKTNALEDNGLPVRSRSSEPPSQNRTDQRSTNRGEDKGSLGQASKGEESQEIGRKPLPKVPVSLKRIIDYKERLKLRGVDPVLVDAIITPSGNTAYGVSVGSTIAFENVVEQFTEDHEIFHQIFQNFDKMRLFKGFDKETLLTEAKDLYGDIPVQNLEEEMAKDFQQYVNDRESGKESTFFGKIKEFFQRLYASFKRLFRNQKDIQEFYRTIAEGQAKEDTTFEGELSPAFNKQEGVADFRDETTPAFNEKPESIEKLRNMLEREQESLNIAMANPEMHAKAYGPDRIQKYKDKIEDLKARIQLVKFPVFDVGNQIEDLKKTLAYSEKRNGVEAFQKADAIIDKVRSIPKSKIELPIELKVIQDEISASNEAISEFETRLEEHPGKKLTLNNAENKLEGTEFTDEFDNEDTIREVKEIYKQDKIRLQELKDQRKTLKEKFSKLRNEFYTEERDRIAINSLVAKEERVKVLEEVGKILRKEGRERKEKINDIQEYFKLTDKEVKELNKGNKDFRLMTDSDFEDFLKKVQGKAYEIKAHRDAVLEIQNTIHDMELKKTENIRQALKMRELKNMSLNELNKFNDLLQTFQHGDEFLGKRQIQTVGLTDLGEIKTHREALQKLAQEAGVAIKNIEEVQPSWKDKYLNDVSLAKRNPLFKVMVENVNMETVAAAQRYQAIKDEFQDLLIDARKSRKRGIFDRLAPTDDLIYKFQEVNDAERVQLMKEMTPEEIKAALFVKQKFLEMRDSLLNQGTLERYVQNYITRMHRSVLEIIKTEGKGILSKEGLKAFVKELWEANKLQKINFKILEDKTGEVLPLEKFFKYSISRTGHLTPSKNVGRVFLEYVRLFEQKKQLDSFIPKLDIFTHVLTSREKTKGGLIKNDTLNSFVKQWLNNKKGRVMDIKIGSPGDPIDFGIRLAIAYTRLHDLAFNIPVGLASNVGAQLSTYIPLGGRKYVKGILRMNLKQGKKLLAKYEPLVGEKLRKQLRDVSKTTGEKTQELQYALFSSGDRRAKSVFLLGLLTPEEYKTGNISNKRLAEIKLEMARYHAIGEMKSLIGSTSLGNLAMQYKTWALPLMQSTTSNLKGLIEVVKNSKEENPFKSKEVRELSRLTISTALLLLSAYETYDKLKNTKNRNFLQNLAYKSMNDALSMIGALDPSLWTKVRVLQFADDLATALSNIAISLVTDTRNAKGEIDGLDVLKAAATPNLVSTLLGKDGPKEKVEDDLNKKIHTAQTKIDAFDPSLISKVQPIFDQAKAAGFGTDEADALVADLSDTEYNVYKALKAKDVAENNLKNQDRIMTIVEKANSLGFGTDEADQLISDSFPDTPEGDADYAAYTSIKNSLYGVNDQKNVSLGEWDKQSFLNHVSNIAEAIGTDPVTLFNNILAGNGSWRVTKVQNGNIFVQRMSEAESQKIKKEQGGATKDFKLDHAIPLEATGNNGGDNLQLIPTGDTNTPGTWAWNSKTENMIGKALNTGEITGDEAREYSIRFKATAGEPLSAKLQKEFKEKYNSESLTPEQIADIISKK